MNILHLCWFAPADDPELVCIVVVDAPQGYPYYGGWVARAFKAIMEDLSL